MNVTIKIATKFVNDMVMDLIDYHGLNGVLTKKELRAREGFEAFIEALIQDHLTEHMGYIDSYDLIENDRVKKFLKLDIKKAEKLRDEKERREVELYEAEKERQRLIAQAQRAEAPVAFLVSRNDAEKAKELLKRGGVKLKGDLSQ